MKKLLTIVMLLITAIAATARTNVVAHRGYWQTPGSAQNSIRALVKADSIGCAASEFDVWITADDVLVVNHNADINGVVIETEKSRKVLKQKLANGERIPTLDKFLETARSLSVDLILEVKPHANPARENIAVDKIIRMVADKGLTDRVTYITFSRNAFDALVANSGRPVFYLNPVRPNVFAEIGGFGPDYHINYFRKNPSWISTFKSMGMPINVWTVDSETDLRWCVDHEVDFVTTNQPELALRLCDEAAAPIDLTVMTFNLRFGERASLDSIAAEIKAANPDFVALQEVDVNTARTAAPDMNGKDMLTELAARTGMFGLYAPAMTFAGGYYGVGILSRHPCVKSAVHELPNPAGVEPRVMLQGDFRLNGHRPVTFCSTHLDVKSADTRHQQINHIRGILAPEQAPADTLNAKKCCGANTDAAKFFHPTIIAGDFNATADEPALQTLCEFADPVSCSDATFPVEAPTRKIDHIYALPRCHATLLDSAASLNTVSDHRAVISRIRLTP